MDILLGKLYFFKVRSLYVVVVRLILALAVVHVQVFFDVLFTNMDYYSTNLINPWAANLEHFF